jgi:lysylphosphatidylglycerol synthetase-like protein (DUF2156 family)
MAITKKSIEKAGEYILFFFFVVFPFGQLLRIEVKLEQRPITIQPIDVIVGLLAVAFFLSGNYKRIERKYFLFFIISIFSLVLSLNNFSIIQVAAGSLYLIRFFAYFVFLYFISLYVKGNKAKKALLYKSLITISTASAIFGWVQYFWYPDLRFLRFLDWDEHLYRLTGTFLDPIFIGLIIVFGFILCLHLYKEKKKFRYLLILAFLAISLAFTYSRASYLALLVALFTHFSLKRFKIYVIVVFALMFTILLLPRPGGEGTRLERVASISARREGYEEIFRFYKTSPLFGIGFNNLCSARENLYSNKVGKKISWHACGGSDSGILHVLTTTGIVGLMIFINTIYIFSKNIRETKYRRVLVSVSVALFVHSFFANSLFYPWIMGYFFILVAITMSDTKEYK